MIYTILYIIICLIIGTMIIHSKQKALYNQITKNEERDSYKDHDLDELVFMIIWYYILWPFPLFAVLWVLFWKYFYISLQHIIILISDSGLFLKERFLPELLSSLKKKRKNK